MIKELDSVILDINLPNSPLKKGDLGTVVLIYEHGKGYEVEFNTLDGKSIDVVTLLKSQIREIKHKEIAHVRKIPA